MVKELKDISKSEKIFLFVAAAIVFGIFSIFVFISVLNSEDKSLKFEQSINLRINKVKRYRGVVMLNDSIVLSENTPAIMNISRMEVFRKYKELNIKKPQITFDKITTPFVIKKKANSDTIQVIQYRDTIYFNLIGD